MMHEHPLAAAAAPTAAATAATSATTAAATSAATTANLVKRTPTGRRGSTLETLCMKMETSVVETT